MILNINLKKYLCDFEIKNGYYLTYTFLIMI